MSETEQESKETGIVGEDHGTEIHFDFELTCQIEDCSRRPDVKVGGYIHFTWDGDSYSKDEIRLCSTHWTVVKKVIEYDG